MGCTNSKAKEEVPQQVIAVATDDSCRNADVEEEALVLQQQQQQQAMAMRQKGLAAFDDEEASRRRLIVSDAARCFDEGIVEEAVKDLTAIMRRVVLAGASLTGVGRVSGSEQQSEARRISLSATKHALQEELCTVRTASDALALRIEHHHADQRALEASPLYRTMLKETCSVGQLEDTLRYLVDGVLNGTVPRRGAPADGGGAHGDDDEDEEEEYYVSSPTLNNTNQIYNIKGLHGLVPRVNSNASRLLANQAAIEALCDAQERCCEGWRRHEKQQLRSEAKKAVGRGGTRAATAAKTGLPPSAVADSAMRKGMGDGSGGSVDALLASSVKSNGSFSSQLKGSLRNGSFTSSSSPPKDGGPAATGGSATAAICSAKAKGGPLPPTSVCVGPYHRIPYECFTEAMVQSLCAGRGTTANTCTDGEDGAVTTIAAPMPRSADEDCIHFLETVCLAPNLLGGAEEGESAEGCPPLFGASQRGVGSDAVAKEGSFHTTAPQEEDGVHEAKGSPVIRTATTVAVGGGMGRSNSAEGPINSLGGSVRRGHHQHQGHQAAPASGGPPQSVINIPQYHGVVSKDFMAMKRQQGAADDGIAAHAVPVVDDTAAASLGYEPFFFPLARVRPGRRLVMEWSYGGGGGDGSSSSAIGGIASGEVCVGIADAHSNTFMGLDADGYDYSEYGGGCGSSSSLPLLSTCVSLFRFEAVVGEEYVPITSLYPQQVHSLMASPTHSCASSPRDSLSSTLTRGGASTCSIGRHRSSPSPPRGGAGLGVGVGPYSPRVVGLPPPTRTTGGYSSSASPTRAAVEGTHQRKFFEGRRYTMVLDMVPRLCASPSSPSSQQQQEPSQPSPQQQQQMMSGYAYLFSAPTATASSSTTASASSSAMTLMCDPIPLPLDVFGGSDDAGDGDGDHGTTTHLDGGHGYDYDYDDDDALFLKEERAIGRQEGLYQWPIAPSSTCGGDGAKEAPSSVTGEAAIAAGEGDTCSGDVDEAARRLVLQRALAAKHYVPFITMYYPREHVRVHKLSVVNAAASSCSPSAAAALRSTSSAAMVRSEDAQYEALIDKVWGFI